MTADDPAGDLRAQLVAQLRKAGALASAAVRAAMEAVPRHLFLPGVPVDEAYANQAVITKRDAGGQPLSSASQPSIVAIMLEQLEVRPGHRVLEIGAGTGYHAALLHTLAGARGQVTSIDIDPELADRAREALGATGYGDVRVVTGDGTLGYQANAPYDRIVVTAGAWDVPPAWWEQLIEGGRLVVPLRWRGHTRSIAFDHHGAYMVSRSAQCCGFLPMQGSDGEGTLWLGDGTVTIAYDEDQLVDRDGLGQILSLPRQEAWSGIAVGGDDSYESFDELWLWLTTVEPGTCQLAAQPPAVASGMVTPAIPARTLALIDGASLAYLAVRPNPDADSGKVHRHELGAVAHGNGDLAHRLVNRIREWDARCQNAVPLITAYPSGTPDDHPAGASAIRKRHISMSFSWG
jgi:protein-L-isoaspartate(D-aspartate) O-methyltransferase